MDESQIHGVRIQKTVRNGELAECRYLGARTGKAIQEPRCSSQLPQLSSYQVNLEKHQALKGPMLEIFVAGIFTQIRFVLVGDL